MATFTLEPFRNGFRLALDGDLTVEADQPRTDGVGVAAAVAVRRNGLLLVRDTVNLTSSKARAAFLARLGNSALGESHLLALEEALREARNGHEEGKPAERDGVPYRVVEDGLVWDKPTPNGPVAVRLTNFTARIVGDVAHDDGAEVVRRFELEASLGGRAHRFTVPAERFAGMTWVTEHLGAEALLYPGMTLRDHARAAIQLLSGRVPARRVYTHTGWRKLGDHWAYLHAGGALGAQGALRDVETALPDALARFVLPDPPGGDALREAVRASLGLLDLAPRRITVPLLAAVYRAALGGTNFAVHLSGGTGVGKTQLATLAQQHYGPDHRAEEPPGSWSSTSNALEGLAFTAKDAVLLVDDFAPTGDGGNIARLHREADRLLRAQGNRAGRHRLRPDGTLRPVRWPRGLIVSTGEETPRGQSLRARLLILDVGPGDVDFERLTCAQAAAAAGAYAAALAGFLRWAAGQYDGLQARLRELQLQYRAEAQRSVTHRRTGDIAAQLAAGWRIVLDFAAEAGGLAPAEAESLWHEGWAALGEAAAAQAAHQLAAEPAARFLELLRAAIASGRAHVAGPNGGAPDDAAAWGWRRVSIGTGEHARIEWQPQGHRVGWVEGADLLLEPEASYAAAQAVGAATGDPLAVLPRTLRKRLHERGLLKAVGSRGGRERLTVRRVLEGVRREVLCLDSSTVSYRAGSAPSAPFEDEDAGGPHGATVSDPPPWGTTWGTSGVEGGKVPHASAPSETAEAASGAGSGRAGVGDGAQGAHGALSAGDTPKAPGRTFSQVDGAEPDVCALCGEPVDLFTADGEPRCAEHADDGGGWEEGTV